MRKHLSKHKHIYLVFLFVLFFIGIASLLIKKSCSAETCEPFVWSPTGTLGFSADEISATDLAFTNSGILHVAYVSNRYDSAENKISVQKLASDEWQFVGSQDFSPGNVGDISFAIDQNDALYVAFSYIDTDTLKIGVMKYNGSEWVQIDPTTTSAIQSGEIKISIGQDNLPVISFTDINDFGKASAMKFDGSSWSYLGGPGFTSGEVRDISMTIDTAGTVYVAFHDTAGDNKTSVMKFENDAWVLAGNANFSEGQASYISIQSNSLGEIYTAYNDSNLGVNGLSVKKLVGEVWTSVGDAKITLDSARYVNLEFDSFNYPYVAFRDSEFGRKLSILKFDGNTWTAVGDRGFTSAQANNISFQIDNQNNLFVAFKDYANSMKLSSMRYIVNPPSRPDTTKPILTLTGNPNIEMFVGDEYTELGATASDDHDGDISQNITTTNNLNANSPGTYTVRYNVSDTAGNVADEISRTITIREKPGIVFIPSSQTNSPAPTDLKPEAEIPKQTTPEKSTENSYFFSKNLRIGVESQDVLMLQVLLNKLGFVVSDFGPGSKGNESNYFGQKTRNALIKFQSHNKLPPTGYFGEMTRSLINEQKYAPNNK